MIYKINTKVLLENALFLIFIIYSLFINLLNFDYLKYKIKITSY